MTRPRSFSKSLMSHLRRPRLQAASMLAVLTWLLCVSIAAADPVTDYSDFPALTNKGTYESQSGIRKIAPYGRYVYCLEYPTNSDEIRMQRWNPASDSFTDLGSLDVNALSLHDIVVTGHYLCVSYQNYGDFVKVYDISNPSSPDLLSTSPDAEPLNFMTPIVYPDGIARFLAWTPFGATYRINLYQISQSNGELSSPGFVVATPTTADIVTRNTSVYIAYSDLANTPRALGINWSNPQVPASDQPYALDGRAYRITPDNEERRLFMSYQDFTEWSSLGITDIKVTGPEVVYETSLFTTEQLYHDPFLLRGVANTSGDKLRLYDASLSCSPDFYVSACPSENPAQIEAFADSVYSKTSSYLNALIINQAYPAGSASHPFDSATDIVAYHTQGDTMSVCYVAGSSGIRIFYTSVPPLSDPLAPVPVQATLLPGEAINSLSISDNDMLVACYEDYVHTYKIADSPDSPQFYKAIGLPSGCTAEKAVVYAGKMYVACGSGGVRIYNMPATESGSITFWRAYSTTTGPAVDLVVKKKDAYILAYVAEGDAGIEILRTNDTNGITRRGRLDTRNAQRLALQETKLYVADGVGGAKIIDVTSATSPSLTDSICGSDVRDVSVAGNELYALDGNLVRVYDVSTPASPARRGLLNAQATTQALDVSKRIWLVDSDALKLAYMQEGTAPSVVPSTIKADVYLDVSSNTMTWEFSWRTKEWTNPALMEAVIRNPSTPPPGCLSFGTSGTTIAYGDGGVTAFVRPTIDGGWLNVLRYEAGYCDANCDYIVKGRCAIESSGMEYAETAEVSFSTTVCIQYEE